MVPNDHDWWFFPAISGLEVHLEKVKKPKTELIFSTPMIIVNIEIHTLLILSPPII